MSSRLISNTITEVIITETVTQNNLIKHNLISSPIYQKLYKNIKINNSSVLNFTALSLEYPKYFLQFFSDDKILLNSRLPEQLADIFSDILQEIELNTEYNGILIKLEEYCNKKKQAIFILKFIIATLISIPLNQQIKYSIYIQTIQLTIFALEEDYKTTLENKSRFFLDNPNLAYYYSQDSLTKEFPGYNGIKQHTIAVINNFITIFAANFTKITGLAPDFMIPILCLHDIGKGIGIHSSDQHHYNQKVIKKSQEKINLDLELADIASLLSSQDIIGDYLKENISTYETAKKLYILFNQILTNIPLMTKSQFFQFMIVYYSCDAGSYPELRKKIFNQDFDFNEIYKTRITNLYNEFLQHISLEDFQEFSYIPEELKMLLKPALDQIKNTTNYVEVLATISQDIINNISEKRYPNEDSLFDGISLLYLYLCTSKYSDNSFVNDLLNQMVQENTRDEKQYHTHIIKQMRRKRELREMWFFKEQRYKIEYESEDESEISNNIKNVITDLLWLKQFNKFDKLLNLPILDLDTNLVHGSNLMVFLWASLLADQNLIGGNEQLEALPITNFTGENGGESDMNRFTVSTMDLEHPGTTFWCSSYALAATDKNLFRSSSSKIESVLRQEGKITEIPETFFKITCGILSKIPVIMQGKACGWAKLLEKTESGKNILVNQEIICSRMKITELIVPDDMSQYVIEICNALKIDIPVKSMKLFLKKYDYFSDQPDFIAKITDIARAFAPSITESETEDISTTLGYPDKTLSIRRVLRQIAKTRCYENGVPLDPRINK